MLTTQSRQSILSRKITARFSIPEHENVDITRHVTYFLAWFSMSIPSISLYVHHIIHISNSETYLRCGSDVWLQCYTMRYAWEDLNVRTLLDNLKFYIITGCSITDVFESRCESIWLRGILSALYGNRLSGKVFFNECNRARLPGI